MTSDPLHVAAEPAITVRDLRRSYGANEAVRGVSFDVMRGEVFCLLGPNGAGKTSIVEILEGYRNRTAGDARVLGIDPATGSRDLRERVGIVLQQCGVQPDLSVAELIEMYGRYHVRRRSVDELIELVELADKRDTRAQQLSGGQRRRLDLALALVGDPELIFLDEPTTGFDPAARRQAWSTLRSLCDLGKTIFLTRISWTRPSTWPIGWRSCAPARSSPPGAPRNWAGAIFARPRSGSRYRRDGP
jgi:ABC-2 type transport system ATP-binding protein